MLDIANFAYRSADIGSQIPKKLIHDAGGLKNFATFDLGVGLKVHRRYDDIRVRAPVNGRRGFKTYRFSSIKNGGRDIHAESGGELPVFSLLEIHSPVAAYREQCDIVEIEDAEGRCWAIPDAFAVLRDGTPVWIEGKYNTRLKRDANGLGQVERGLPVKVKMKLRRVQRAFRSAGLSYVVVNQSWCRQPVVSRNIELVFWSRKICPSPSEKDELLELLKEGKSTVGACEQVFESRDCPAEWVCSAMARGWIEIDIRVPLSRDSTVTLPGTPFWRTGEQC